MDSIEQRLSEMEALQTFTLGIATALIEALRTAGVDAMPLIRTHLERHHAQYLAASKDEHRLETFQDLLKMLQPAERDSGG